MKMQVSEQGNEVLIDLLGVAGRHQSILQVLTRGPMAGSAGESALGPADLSVRAGAHDMHIRVKGRAGQPFQALSIYHYLRHALIESHVGRGRDDGADDERDAGLDCPDALVSGAVPV